VREPEEVPCRWRDEHFWVGYCRTIIVLGKGSCRSLEKKGMRQLCQERPRTNEGRGCAKGRKKRTSILGNPYIIEESSSQCTPSITFRNGRFLAPLSVPLPPVLTALSTSIDSPDIGTPSLYPDLISVMVEIPLPVPLSILHSSSILQVYQCRP
jgi:hypothetical protein